MPVTQEVFDALTQEEREKHEDLVVLESHIFRVFRRPNLKEDIGFTHLYNVLVEVVCNEGSKYDENLKMLIKAMSAFVFETKIIRHDNKEAVFIKAQYEEHIKRINEKAKELKEK
jgi:hypothetical protein